MTTQPDQASPAPNTNIILPDGIYICTKGGNAYALAPDGEIFDWPIARAVPSDLDIRAHPVITCFSPRTAKVLNLAQYPAFDVLELFAFTCPAQFCTPTITGICNALQIPPPETEEDEIFILPTLIKELLFILSKASPDEQKEILKIAQAMGRQGEGWNWTPYVMHALGSEYNTDIPILPKKDLNTWKNLEEWSEEAPKPPAQHHTVTEDDVMQSLKSALDRKVQFGQQAFIRKDQNDYSQHMRNIFTPRHENSPPHVLIAEAGTGIGKTLGYLAPIHAWTQKNEQSVWISTYTKNLQRQLGHEIKTIYETEEERQRKAVIRKGRENYLCLLNLEEAVASSAMSRSNQDVICAGMMARWVSKTSDGDLTGSDFPGWLSQILGYQFTYALADKRGECIYSACDHYHKCFIERAVRKSKRAEIVIANHALLMIQIAAADMEDDLPTRYVFDEGHHLFDAADSAFGAHLTGYETTELRRWLIGPETQNKRAGRAKGLRKRIEDLISGEENAETHLNNILIAAQCLPAPGWKKRIADNAPRGEVEEFLAEIRQQIIARTPKNQTFYTIETDLHPVSPEIARTAIKLQTALQKVKKPINALSKTLLKRLDEDAAYLEKDTRKRIDGIVKGLHRRGELQLSAWINMLDMLTSTEQQPDLENLPQQASGFIDWLELTRVDGKDFDIGMYRHFTDPMKPFSDCISIHAHGVAVTSATLRASSNNMTATVQENTDGTEETETLDWDYADKITGVPYFKHEDGNNSHINHISLPSPFKYEEQTRVIIITDVSRNDGQQVSTAFRELFKASNGSALGIFTAINRLKHVHKVIQNDLNALNIPIYAQHIDDIDIGTLIDMFKEEERSCLLGTDAVRDGVDVPGDSLRLIVFDRTPWPRPTILHRERRKYFGGREYDNALTKMKLKQAYGRLIRSEGDKGVFVMLDSALPSHMHDAFPEGTQIEKLPLSEALAAIKEFLPATDA